MASIFRKLFRRKKQPPLVCAVDLDHGPNHHHGAACFVDFEPLAVVELFLSQGCPSCPPAIPGILAGASFPNCALLSYNVTLFDHLGWRDTHASPRWDARQRDYIRRWGRAQLFTPMVVVDGMVNGPGAGGKPEIDDIVGRAREAHKARGWQIYVDANDTDVRVDSDRQPGDFEPYDILLVTYDAAAEKVKVGKGPNKGKKIEHRNVVRDIAKVGEWAGGNAVLPLPTPKAALPSGVEALVMVQEKQGGPIVAAAKVYSREVPCVFFSVLALDVLVEIG